MFKVLITKSGNLTHEGTFETFEEAQNWIIHQSSRGAECPWGMPEHEIDGQIIPSEFEVTGPFDITAQVAQETINTEALAYLASTDWYIIREMDEGIACPADIKQLRADARARIVR